MIIEYKGSTGVLRIGDWLCSCLVKEGLEGTHYIEQISDDVWGNEEFILRSGHNMKDTKNGIVVGHYVLLYKDEPFVLESQDALDKLNTILSVQQQWELEIKPYTSPESS